MKDQIFELELKREINNFDELFSLKKSDVDEKDHYSLYKFLEKGDEVYLSDNMKVYLYIQQQQKFMFEGQDLTIYLKDKFGK